VAATPAEEIKSVQLTSSNVPYLKSLVWALIQSKNPVAVRKVFTYKLDPFTVIEPSEKFKPLPVNQSQGASSKKTGAKYGNDNENDNDNGNDNPGGESKGGRARGKERGTSILPLITSQPLSTAFVNEQVFQVKVDVVTDHGKSWLRINAGSVWSLAHEFAGMEDESDEEEEEEEDDDDDDEKEEEEKEKEKEKEKEETGGEGKNDFEGDDKSNRGLVWARASTRKPIHVSKDTHPDMTLLTRSLVLAADQNRLHYNHIPSLTLRFAGVQPDESPALEAMIHRSVRVGRVAQSVSEGTYRIFPVQTIFGPIEPSRSTPEEASQFLSGTPLDPSFAPFSIPSSVDDMVLFTKTLHLDITTLMALSSFLCHTIRPNPKLFTSPPLVLQAQQEHDQPLLPLLAKIFEGRDRLVMSRAAVTRFKSILNVIGGPEEKWRGKVMFHDPLKKRSSFEADETIENKETIRERWVRGSDWAQQYGVFATGPPRIEVIEDILGPDQNQQELVSESELGEEAEAVAGAELEQEQEQEQEQDQTNSNTPTGVNRRELNMTQLHTRIFATGYYGRLTTITANQVGYRAVIQKGYLPGDISVWYHSPRSLAEAKLPVRTEIPIRLTPTIDL
ncbi:hypothetical protein BX616_006046, partial [Lobosporangium transversale]